MMATQNIREKILESEVADRVEGVSGRWTFFTMLKRPELD